MKSTSLKSLRRLLGMPRTGFKAKPKSRRRNKPALERLENRFCLSTFVVNTIADDVDADDGVLSLREAITQANADADVDFIQFALGANRSITVDSELPGILHPVTIDAAAQVGANPVTLATSVAGGGVNGLVIDSGGVVIHGLRIEGFGGDGIRSNTTGSLVLNEVIVSNNLGFGVRHFGSLVINRATDVPDFEAVSEFSGNGKGGVFASGFIDAQRGLIAENNQGPGIAAFGDVSILVGVSLFNNFGPGIQSIDGRVELTRSFSAPDDQPTFIIIDNAGPGIIAGDNPGVDLPATSDDQDVFINGAAIIEGNRGWGIAAPRGNVRINTGPAGLGAQFSDQRTSIARNALSNGLVFLDFEGQRVVKATTDYEERGGIWASGIIEGGLVDVIGNGGPGVLAQREVFLNDPTSRNNVGPGIQSLTASVTIRAIDPFFDVHVRGNAGAGIVAGSMETPTTVSLDFGNPGPESNDEAVATQSIFIVGPIFVTDNAGWGLIAAQDVVFDVFDEPRTSEITRNGNRSLDLMVYIPGVGSDQLPQGNQEVGGGIAAGNNVISENSLAAFRMVVADNDGPGIVAGLDVNLALPQVTGNRGPGITSILGSVSIFPSSFVFDPETRITDNHGAGIDAHQEVIFHTGNVTISNNAFSGIVAGNVVRPDNTPAAPIVISANANPDTSNVAFIVEDDGAVDPIPAGSFADAAGVEATGSVALSDVVITHNFGHGVVAENDVFIERGIISNNTGEPVIAGGTITLIDVSDGSPVVVNTDDEGFGSLRNAVIASGEVTFDLETLGPGPHVINLSRELTIARNVTILGPGSDVIAIDGSGATRLFSISEPNGDIQVAMEGLTLRGGAGDEGGAIRNDGAELILRDVVLSGNRANAGGGIYSVPGSSDGGGDPYGGDPYGGDSYGGGSGNSGISRLEIIDSQITDNLAFDGGAVWSSIATVIQGSTLSGNLAFSNGGAVFLAFDDSGSQSRIETSTLSSNSAFSDGGALWVGTSLVAENVTISGNSADLRGGGIHFDFASPFAELRHVTITQNTAGDPGGGLSLDNSFAVSLINSIVAGNDVDDVAGELASDEATLIGGDALLGPLQDNGGNTFTHALLAGSPAIDAGINLGVSEDQRGQIRIGAPDVGAYEFAVPAETLVADFTPGPGSSGIFPIGTVNGLLVFQVHVLLPEDLGAVSRRELYATRPGGDGLVKIADGIDQFGDSATVGNFLYFRGFNENGFGMFRTDGTAAGTQFLFGTQNGEQIGPVLANSLSEFVELNGVLYFVGEDAREGEGATGVEVYRLTQDGQPELIFDLHPGDNVNASHPGELTMFNNRIYFTATDEQGFSREIYSTSGAVGDVRLEVPGVPGETVFHLTAGDDELFFLRREGGQTFDDGVNLFALGADGDVTRLTTPGQVFFRFRGDGQVSKPVYVGEHLYFESDDGIPAQQTGGTNSFDLWASDGTALGTQVLVASAGITRGLLGQTGNVLYFDVNFLISEGSPFRTKGIFRTDGTQSGTFSVFTEDGGLKRADTHFGYHGNFYFTAETFVDVFTRNLDLWVSEQTPGGTHPFINWTRFNRFGGPRTRGVSHGLLYFTGDDGVTGGELHAERIEDVSADLLVKNDDVNQPFRGNNDYEDTPAIRQTVGQVPTAGETARYSVLVENDGDAEQSFVVRSTSRRNSDWNVTILAGGQDVTAQVFGAGFETSSLNASGVQLLTVEVTPRGGLVEGAVLPLTFGVFDDGSAKDYVRVITSILPFTATADLHVGAGDTFVGDDVFEQVPSEAQTFQQTIIDGLPASYDVLVENDGDEERSFLVKSPTAIPEGWTVSYFADGVDVTNLVRGAGFQTALLEANTGAQVITIEVTPSPEFEDDEQLSLIVEAFDAPDRVFPNDAVRMTTSTFARIADLQAKAATEDSEFIGNGVYELEASATQTVTQFVAPNGTVRYEVLVQNDSISQRRFSLKAPTAIPDSWTVRYLVNDIDITSVIQGLGFETELLAADGGSQSLFVEVTAGPEVASEEVLSLVLQVFKAAEDTTPKDAVVLSTSASRLIVNMTGDEPDPDLEDGVPDVDLVTSGIQTTLRAALQNAELRPGADEITFDIPESVDATLQINTALPDLTQPIVIDGRSQAGNRVVLVGNGGNFPGLSVLGGDSLIAGLVISGFGVGGIVIDGDNNIVEGNFIGTDRDGMVAVPNGAAGISIVNGNGNRIGGASPEQGNVISGNLAHGVFMSAAEQNVIAGNMIGLGADGLAPLGNGGAGVFLDFASANLIGFSVDHPDSAGNVIGNNALSGIHLQAASDLNAIHGNLIGVGVDGESPAGNLGDGIRIVSGLQNTIGLIPNLATVVEEANTIAFNEGAGIAILAVASGAPNTSNSISGNSIYANNGLGIDLNADGRSLNVSGNSTTGANGLRNAPVISLLEEDGVFVQVSGSLHSVADTTFIVEFFYSNPTDATRIEHGNQGREFVHSIEVTTDASGVVHFQAVIPVAREGEQTLITATARDDQGNTSEFSTPTPDLQLAGGGEIRTPVVLVPGIFGSFPDVASDVPILGLEYIEWLLQRGFDPDGLIIDPVGLVYQAMVQTLEKSGYVQGVDLIVVPYDWRLPVAPANASTPRNGFLDSLTVERLTDGRFEFGVDYLTEALKAIAENWFQTHGQPLTDVHYIGHSMGGLVGRAYLQSAAYGQLFGSTVVGRDLPLPLINNFTTIGTPHQGAAGSWNAWHDNFIRDLPSRLVLSKVMNHAFQKAIGEGAIINPDSTFIDLSGFDTLEEQKLAFLRQYSPSIGNLLPTYNFATNFVPTVDLGGTTTTENTNHLLEVLNANSGVVTHVPKVARNLVIYGASHKTPDRVELATGTILDSLVPDFGEIISFDAVTARDPEIGEQYYVDLFGVGDETVPLISAEGLFVNDGISELFGFAEPGKARSSDITTIHNITHTGLMSNVDVQSLIRDIFVKPSSRGPISTLGQRTAGNAAGTVLAPILAFNLIVDPVDALLVDSQGRRLGYSEETGPLQEIPNSVYLGGADGIGWVFDPDPEDGPFTLQLKGLGEQHYVQFTSHSESAVSGLDDTTPLAAGETRTIDIQLPIAPEQVDLAAAFVDLPTSTVGQNTTYSVALQNLGADAAPDSILHVQFDSPISVASAPAGTVVNAVNHVLSIPVGDLDPQASATVSFTVVPQQAGSLSVQAILFGGENTVDTDIASNLATATTFVNDNPIAVDDAVSTDEDTAVVISVLSNDSDVDGDTLTAAIATAPSNGSASVNADGTITYTPNLDFVGGDAFTYSVSDGNGGSATATVNVTVLPLNEPPEITSLVNSSPECGGAAHDENVSITATFTAPNTGDTHTATIDWGDGTVTAGTVNQATDTVTGNHVYDDGGIYTITVTVSDQSDSDHETTDAFVTGVRLTADGVLQIIGTEGRDHVNLKVNEKKDELKVDVKLNQGGSKGGPDGGSDRIQRTFALSSIERIVSYLCGGDDHYNGGSLAFSQFVFGGAGNDHIQGGRGNDVLSGGSGNDHIQGGDGHDILIGGTGKDKLHGGRGDDLLVGGSSANEDDLTSLDAALADWTSGDLASALVDLGAITDDGDKDDLKGEQGMDHLIGGAGDKQKQ